MHFTWFSSNFPIFSKFHQINERGGKSNFLWGNNSRERLNCLLTLLYFNAKHLKDSTSLSFTRFLCILHDSSVLFSFSQNFLKLMWEGHNFLWGNNSAKQLNYLLIFLYFNVKDMKSPNSSSFIRVQCILHDSSVLLSFSQNILKLMRGN